MGSLLWYVSISSRSSAQSSNWRPTSFSFSASAVVAEAAAPSKNVPPSDAVCWDCPSSPVNGAQMVRFRTKLVRTRDADERCRRCVIPVYGKITARVLEPSRRGVGITVTVCWIPRTAIMISGPGASGKLSPKSLSPKSLSPKSLSPKSLSPKSLSPKSLRCYPPHTLRRNPLNATFHTICLTSAQLEVRPHSSRGNR